MQSQSEVPEFPRLRPYSRQLLQTLTLHARQNAPRFMIRPNSDRHRPQLRFGSEAHKLLRPLAKLMLLVKFEFDVGWATGAQWCVLTSFFPQFYEPHFGTWILLFGQLRALRKKSGFEVFWATFEGGFFNVLRTKEMFKNILASALKSNVEWILYTYTYIFF